jgi:hypothetical protein
MYPVTRKGWSFLGYFGGALDTKSGAPWWTAKGINELTWVDGKRPEREEWEAPFFTQKGFDQFWGIERNKKRSDEPIEPPLFTKTGWANMKKKYGTEVKLAGPLYTKTGMQDWIGWGDKWGLADNNIAELQYIPRVSGKELLSRSSQKKLRRQSR